MGSRSPAWSILSHREGSLSHAVMRGLDPRIHGDLTLFERIAADRMDCRVKPGNDALKEPVSIKVEM
jgi:hypothetical protein